MRLTIALGFMLVCALAEPVSAKESTGRLLISVNKQEGIPSSWLVAYWKVDTLLGEPIVNCAGTWIVAPDTVAFYRSNPFGRPPADVLRGVRLFNVEIEAFITDRGGLVSPGVGQMSRVRFSCDLGAMGDPFIGLLETYEKLPAEERKRLLSFNVPGSPSWDALFKDLEADDAKRTVAIGFSLYQSTWDKWRPRITKAEYSHASVEAWVAEQEAEKRRIERERLEHEARKREEKLSTGANGGRKDGKGPEPAAKSTDPWDQPARAGPVKTSTAWDAPEKALSTTEARRVEALVREEQDLRARAGAGRGETQRIADQLRAHREQLAVTQRGGCADRIKAADACIKASCGQEPLYSPDVVWLQIGACDAECSRRSEEARKARNAEKWTAYLGEWPRYRACHEAEQGRCGRGLRYSIGDDPMGGYRFFADQAACEAEVRAQQSAFPIVR